MKTVPITLLQALLPIAFVTGVFTPKVTAQVTNASAFQEVFHLNLGEYWCENHLATVDFDRDGWMDIVLMVTALRSTNGPPWSYKCRAILLHNEGDGSFTGSVVAEFPSSYGYFAAAADLNGDGAPDLVLREHSGSHVLLNDGSGRSFREVFAFLPGYYPVAVADVNRDGFLDLISGTQTGTGGLIELFTNDGTGTNFSRTWQSRRYGSGYDAIQTILIANLNDDDHQDIVAREIYSGLLVTLRGTNNGNSPFVEQSVLNLGERTFALAGGNVNGDSRTDVAAHVGWGSVRVFACRNDGFLIPYWQSPNLGQPAYGLALADFDHDGLDDVFVGTFGDGALRIYRNKIGNGFELWWQGKVPGEGYTGTVGDLNSDGYPDLIVGEKHGIRLLLNRAGIPKMKNLSVSGGVPLLTWTATKGKNYRVQYKAHFADSYWIDLDGDVTANGFTAGKLDGTGTSSEQRFYRVIELP